ncbi:glutamate receptor ionotropic, delta-1-like [Oratosquilla oratoria]|uniref:glutamate receptor ionotropic, delta-1-like n=1 Tax=Oratosquilla oratoria TaxID=337810 RepID=UPI003F774259
MFDVLDMVARRHNLCYNIAVTDSQWGIKHKNGSWTGHIGYVARKEVDVFLGPVAPHPLRTEIMDFTDFLFMFGHHIVYKRPKIEPNLTAFVKPFTLMRQNKKTINSSMFHFQTWGLLFLVIVVMLLTILIANKGFIQSGQNLDTSTGSKKPISVTLKDLWLWIVGIPLGQGSTGGKQRWLKFSGVSGVASAVQWMMFCFLIACMYKTYLIAMLVIPRVSIPFDTLDEMVNQHEIKYKIGGYVTIYQVLQQAEPNSTFGRVFSGKSGVSVDFPDAIGDLKNNIAIITSTLPALTLMQETFVQGYCGSTVAGETFSTGMMGVGLQKNSNYTRFFNQVPSLPGLWTKTADVTGLSSKRSRIQFRTRKLCLKMEWQPPKQLVM